MDFPICFTSSSLKNLRKKEGSLQPHVAAAAFVENRAV
ncbi:hypothetical protein RB2083_2288 [Rhodobacteraceae bacterium HTCC2083]|nr:hypothetical protein RB2083_2288 [Rhodobacteraceae bacterium HTCC2083]